MEEEEMMWMSLLRSPTHRLRWYLQRSPGTLRQHEDGLRVDVRRLHWAPHRAREVHHQGAGRVPAGERGPGVLCRHHYVQPSHQLRSGQGAEDAIICNT